MWQELMAAFCLVLIIEGMLPFLSPARWRKAVFGLAQMNDQTLRLTGLVSMLLGAAALYIIR